MCAWKRPTLLTLFHENACPLLPTINQGKYGVAIVWSDGHYATIYTFDALEKVAARVAAEAAAAASGGGAV